MSGTIGLSSSKETTMKLHTQIPINRAPDQRFRLRLQPENQQFGSAGIDWTTGQEDPETSLSISLGDGVSYSTQTGVSVDLGGDYQGLSVSQDGSVTYYLEGAGQINPTGPFNGTSVTATEGGYTVDPDGPNNLVKLSEQTGLLTLDPEGPGNQLQIRQTEHGIVFDPVGPDNNVTITQSDNGITLATA